MIAAETQLATVSLMDLTAGETELRALPFADGAMEADITAGDTWQPPLPDLDAIVLRLGGGAQATNILLRNLPAGG